MAPVTCEHQGMDLTSADWWVRTTVKRLQDIDPNLRFNYMYVPATNMSHLHIDNISEQSLSKLAFMVNTNSNNNYGYLEDLLVYVQSDYSRRAIPIPGFSDLANAIWNKSDSKSYDSQSILQTPFVNPLNNPITNEPISIPEYVDLITGIIPWLPKTLGQVKIFEVILSPGIDSTSRSEGAKDSHKSMTSCYKVPKSY
jgi:hypothetical protein